MTERGRERSRVGLAGTRLLAIAVLVLLLVFGVLSAMAVWGGDGTQRENEVFGYLVAAIVLAAFTGLIQLMGRGIQGLVLGVDNRISTSKMQVALWTYIVAAAILALIAQTWVGADAGFDNISDADFESYLVLLGGPFAAAIGSRMIVGAQVEKGESAKPPGEPKAAQVVTNDNGNADLIDTQYLLFNLIAMVYFLGAFIEKPEAGLPAIPTFLYVLTGASALGFVTNKAIPSGPPKIESISPATGAKGKEVTVFGNGLLFPLDATATATPTRLSQFHEVQVMVGGRQAEIVDGSVSSTKAGGDRFRIVIPRGLTEGEEHDVVALNFRGTQTNAVRFKVVKELLPRRRVARNGRRAKAPA